MSPRSFGYVNQIIWLAFSCNAHVSCLGSAVQCCVLAHIFLDHGLRWDASQPQPPGKSLIRQNFQHTQHTSRVQAMCRHMFKGSNYLLLIQANTFLFTNEFNLHTLKMSLLQSPVSFPLPGVSLITGCLIIGCICKLSPHLVTYLKHIFTFRNCCYQRPGNK